MIFNCNKLLLKTICMLIGIFVTLFDVNILTLTPTFSRHLYRENVEAFCLKFKNEQLVVHTHFWTWDHVPLTQIRLSTWHLKIPILHSGLFSPLTDSHLQIPKCVSTWRKGLAVKDSWLSRGLSAFCSEKQLPASCGTVSFLNRKLERSWAYAKQWSLLARYFLQVSYI